MRKRLHPFLCWAPSGKVPGPSPSPSSSHSPLGHRIVSNHHPPEKPFPSSGEFCPFCSCPQPLRAPPTCPKLEPTPPAASLFSSKFPVEPDLLRLGTRNCCWGQPGKGGGTDHRIRLGFAAATENSIPLLSPDDQYSRDHNVHTGS